MLKVIKLKLKLSYKKSFAEMLFFLDLLIILIYLFLDGSKTLSNIYISQFAVGNFVRYNYPIIKKNCRNGMFLQKIV